MAPGFGEAREPRPASDLAPGGRDLPRVVVAVGRVRQVRREVDRRQAHELRGQIVRGERRAVVRGAGAAIRTWVANRHGRTVPAEWPIGADRSADLTPAVPDEPGPNAEIRGDFAFDIGCRLSRERVLQAGSERRGHAAARDAEQGGFLARIPDTVAVQIGRPAVLAVPPPRACVYAA